MKNLRNIALASAAFLFTSGAVHADGLKVVASFSIIGDMAKQVGGDKVSVTTLVGPDSDAHVYEPRPQDAASVAEADVVLINGLGFEGFIERLTKASPPKSATVELAKGIETIEAGEEGHGHDEAKETKHEGEHKHEEAGHAHEGSIDPHAFQSVANVRVYVKNIADTFCSADAANCDAYKANAAAYDEKLGALDAEIKAAVETIPAEKRVVITSHDAFGYFAHAYGLTFHAPEGISTESEASAADVATLIDQIREEKASAIFVENISDPRLIEQISKEAGVKVGGALYSDALSGPDGPAATYIDLMRHNVMTIKGAILGS
jgi:zinc/manganese transport system substrate-binding protein